MDGGENTMEKMEERLKELEHRDEIFSTMMYYVLTGRERTDKSTRGYYEGHVINVDFSSWSGITRLLAIIEKFKTHAATHDNYYDRELEAIAKAVKNTDEAELGKALQALADTIYLE